MPDKTILVTGGAGYIGSHTCKALARAGYQPVVYDNLSRGHEWAVKWGPLEVGDLRDSVKLTEVLKRYKPSAVLHFAAFTYVGESVEAPALYYENNIGGALSLLSAMREAGVLRIVFSSTAAVYGMPEVCPIPETAALTPINPYGFTKLAIERILEDYGRAYGVTSVALRYFNAAGADPDAETGEVHDPETHLIPIILQAAAGRRSHVTVFGEDYDTQDGTCIRDYIHVTDLAEAHVLALTTMEVAPGTLAFNLGNGAGFSVKEVLRTAAEVTGCQIPVTVGARREGDPAVLVSDSMKARDVLGWAPSHADLREIISTAWQWMQKHKCIPH